MNPTPDTLDDRIAAAERTAAPNPDRMNEVRRKTLQLARTPVPARRGLRIAASLLLALTGLSAVGLAATDTGRQLIRRIFTPIAEDQVMVWHAPSEEKPDETAAGTTHGAFTYSQGSNRPEPYTAKEHANFESAMAEIHAIAQRGGGRLIGLIEAPDFDGSATQRTIFQIEYTLSNGRTRQIGGDPQPAQRDALRIDEILALRDAGQGELISEQPFDVGLGRYVIRFTLADGSTIDLDTCYPPGTRAEREAIFAETRRLEEAGAFEVLHATKTPDGRVFGLLRYHLADGRTVGITEYVPPEFVTDDGAHVAVPSPEPSEE
jgi:hypothetical protein